MTIPRWATSRLKAIQSATEVVKNRSTTGNIVKDAVGELIFHNRYSYTGGNPVNRVDRNGLIPERDKISSDDYEYTYSCNCGWIDWKHADPNITARRVIELVQRTFEYYVQAGSNAKVAKLSAWDLSHNITVPLGPLGRASLGTFHEDVYIDCDMTANDILPIAMAIFRSVEMAHEGSIPSWFSRFSSERWTNYAEEDLTSNLIAFYRAVDSQFDGRYGENAQLPNVCDYPSDESTGQQWSQQVFEEYGDFDRIYSWESPRLHSTPAINNRCAGKNRQWPSELRRIQPNYDLWETFPGRSGESLYNSLIHTFGRCGVRGIHRITLPGLDSVSNSANMELVSLEIC